MQPVKDLAPVESFARLLDAESESIAAVVPRGYPAYIRVLNPVDLPDGTARSWSALAQHVGVTPSAWMQWDDIDPVVRESLAEPASGEIEPRTAHTLAAELGAGVPLSNLRQRHYFAAWEGYGTMRLAGAVVFPPHGRGMVAYSGDLYDGRGKVIVPRAEDGRVPLYWWPDDLRWVVGQDVYARSVVVACSRRVGDRILSSGLDAYEVGIDDALAPEDR
jgi:hypothetical protein